jgi:tubulin-folding cofactor B
MSMQTAGDIPLQITSENSSSERRITPSWTIGQLKAKLEPVTGIPPLSQKLTLRLGGHRSVPIEAVDEENTQLGRFPLAPYAEIHVSSDFVVRFAETCCDTLIPCPSLRLCT